MYWQEGIKMVLVKHVRCPECQNTKVYRYGKDCIKGKVVQKYKCPLCGYQWREK